MIVTAEHWISHQYWKVHFKTMYFETPSQWLYLTLQVVTLVSFLKYVPDDALYPAKQRNSTWVHISSDQLTTADQFEEQ
jgi:hypothetical protein